jgi:DinB superfamily
VTKRRRSARASLPVATRSRLETQLQALPAILGEATGDELDRRSPTGQWSARENLAHLARHHEVMLERLTRILAEDAPQLRSYRAEDDPEWPRWSERSTVEVLKALPRLRARLLARIRSLTPAQAARVGVHSNHGPMSVGRWLEFFLVHEAHHLYVIFGRLAEARRDWKRRD